METKSLEPYLISQPLFRDLDQNYVQLLTQCASNVRFKENKYIFRQGDPADRFYLIREGTVSLEIPSVHQGPLIIQTIGKGEVLGWSWLFPPYQWHFDARVQREIRAVSMDGRCLRGKCDEDPALGYELMKRFSAIMHERMQAARLQIIDLYGPTSS